LTNSQSKPKQLSERRNDEKFNASDVLKKLNKWIKN